MVRGHSSAAWGIQQPTMRSSEEFSAGALELYGGRTPGIAPFLLKVQLANPFFQVRVV